MFVLNVDLDVKPGAETSLEKTYKEVFIPAISEQEGFTRVELLRPYTAGTADYRLVIVFEDHPAQQRWVAAPLHQEVWPKMESHFNKYCGQNYSPV